jgi:hypothetical protein
MDYNHLYNVLPRISMLESHFLRNDCKRMGLVEPCFSTLLWLDYIEFDWIGRDRSKWDLITSVDSTGISVVML